MSWRDILGFPLLVIALVAAGIQMWVLASPRTPVDTAYRTLPPSHKACADQEGRAPASKASQGSELVSQSREWRCFYQRHANRKANFELAVIEFGEDGRLLLPEQKDELLRQVAGKKVIMPVFVHGWRHDARRENRNLADFRLMLSYMDIYRQQRCANPSDPDARYCDHKVVGVFVAWRGASIVEEETTRVGSLSKEAEETFSYKAIPAYLSFPDRKAVSDGPLAEGIGKVLREISGQLRAEDKGLADPAARNRMMITGHSLGANILLNAFGKEMAAEVETKGAINVAIGWDTQKKKEILRPPAGDLIVLLNPAAEARKWTILQHAARKVADVEPNDEVNDTSGKVFAAHQGPVMISYTSTCDWGEIAKQSGGQCFADITGDKADNTRCDWVTSRVFRLFKQVDAFSWSAEETIAVGHLLGKVDAKSLAGGRVGATHESEINKSSGFDTNFWNAGSVKTAPCTRIDGIYDRSEIEQKCRNLWDLELTFDTPAAGVGPGSDEWKKLSRWQLRRGVLRGCYNSPRAKDCKGGACRYYYPELTTTRDPFWNARVINDVLSGHNSVFHHHLWCGANQFLLDRLTFEPGEPPKLSFPGPTTSCPAPAPPPAPGSPGSGPSP